jgi:Flp pilus assembly protein CpaB
MSGRRIAILLLIGGIIVLLLAAIAYVALQNRGTPTPPAADVTPDPNATPGADEVAATLPPTAAAFVEVVVSLQTVPRGHQMTEAELRVDLLPAEDVGPNVITRIEDAVGLYARADIFQGEVLTVNSLVGDPRLVGIEEYGPSSLIPQGFVAQAVPMDRLSSVGYALAAGDSVDVLLSFMITEVDPEFQSLLENSAAFTLEQVSEDGQSTFSILILDPLGRFEALPTGENAMISPSEPQRPMRVAILLQNARVVQVGPYVPGETGIPPTATPTPTVAPEITPSPGPGVVLTPTPSPPDVLLLALAPQQQLLLKYAVEVGADIDYALRPPNDSQIYTVENVDVAYILSRFGIDIPADFEYTLEPVLVTVTPPPPETTPTPTQ